MYGKGSMVFANKSRYTGGWKNGIQHGWGILTNPDGSTQVVILDSGEPDVEKIL